MHDVAVERGEILCGLHVSEQVGAHRDQFAGAARCAVEAADQLLPPRLGGEMQRRWRRRRPGCARQAFDRLGELAAVGPEIADQRLEKGPAAVGVEVVIAVEHVARHRGARRLAAAGQQRLAQFDQVLGIVLAVVGSAAAQQRAAAFGNRGEQVGEKGVGHVSRQSNPGDAESYIGFMAKSATIKHMNPSTLPCDDGYAAATSIGRYSASTNSVGVLPVTWRNAWEKAGTLA